MTDSLRIDTQLVHAGEPRPRIGGAANVPIFQSTVFEYDGGASAYGGIPYPRLSNLPNHRLLAGKLAALEGGADALVTASGMAAISTTLLALLRSGDHLLVQDGLYGGTHGFVHDDLPQLGIATTAIAARDPASWDRAMQPTTRAIYVEAITNPTMSVVDHRQVVAFARRHGLLSIVDSTFATPVNFRPLQLGYDICLHSATKYLNGHSDLVAGAVIGRGDVVARIKERLDHLGGTLDPHACFLLARGLRTLALRVRHQNASAMRIARFLADHAAVTTVHHPGLESHPDHAVAEQLFSGFGGMLAFDLGGDDERVDHFLRRLTLPIIGPSLGGCETLMTRPARTSHVSVPPAERERQGITATLIRMSVGIEDPDDLIADLDLALR